MLCTSLDTKSGNDLFLNEHRKGNQMKALQNLGQAFLIAGQAPGSW